MKKILFHVGLILIAASAFGTGVSKDANFNDRILICLQPDLALERISSVNGAPVTGIEAVDALLSLREVESMEQYVPGSTMDDMDGDVILANIYRLRFKNTRTDLSQLISDFSKNESILYAEPEAINRLYYTPNDPHYGQQWFLPKVGANDAWDIWDISGGIAPGNINIVLASVDSGVQYTHPDLWPSVWVNQAEVPAAIFSDVDTDSDGRVTSSEIMAYISDYNGVGGITLQDALHSSSPFMNGLDDDDWDATPSTFIDDLFGWDPSGATEGNDPDNDPITYPGLDDHGTHVAGLLGASTDNAVGISSAIFNGSIMSVKCTSDESELGFIYDGYPGMLYAAKAGADIINLSWGGDGGGDSNQSIINVCYNTYGALIVAAAGNDNTSDPHYPSAFTNVISVAATGSGDSKAGFSNYGTTVDISAPGVNMRSTVYTAGGSYISYDGTSMASPLVASCFGLLKSANPEASNEWLIENMLSTADPIDDINPNYVGLLGAGRINVHNAIAHTLFPLLSYDSYSLQMINDNEDGQLSPGEEARMRVNLFNAPSWVDAEEVTGILRSTSEYVTISDSTGSFGNIINGNVGVNFLDRFQFSIAADGPSGAYPFSLEVIANDASHRYTITLEFSVEASIWQANFPVSSGVIKDGNAVVDLDGDGNKEIIFGASDSLIHAIQVDGTELAGFPVTVGDKIESTPAVGDVDNDGDLEILIGSKDKNLYLIQHDGSAEVIYTASNYLFASTTLYDLDDDGDLEVIAPGYGNELIVVHHDGSNYAGFPLILEGHMNKGAAVGDMNGDGNLNIIVGTWGEKLHAFKLDGTEVAGFPVTVPDKIKSAPTLVDLDGSDDGQLEIVFGCDDNRLHVYSSTGESVWSYSTPGQNVQSDPAVCDMDGDGDLEVAFGGVDRGIYVLDHTGTLLDGFPVFTNGAISGSPAIGDVDGDGEAEVFIGSTDQLLYGLHLDGTLVTGFPVTNSNPVQGSPSIADFDGDNDLEIIIGTDVNLAVVDLNSTGDLAMYWPTHRGNLHRTGTLPTTVSANQSNALPEHYSLFANFPNPFNPATQISFEIPTAGDVNLQVLDIRGRQVEVLLNTHVSAGMHTLEWAGSDRGKPASAGIYFYRLTTQDGNLVRKMTLLR